MMGVWSRSVGELFLEWIEPRAGLDWVDVGCGSGAFTGLIVEWCAPRSVLGVDPSEAQLDFARKRGLGPFVRFARGDAMSLDVADRSVDIAVAALVVHFMPDPKRGVAEMTRVVRPGGMIAAYAWDLAGGGFPYEAVHAAMRSFGVQVPDPPHPEAANANELARLWKDAGLVEIDQREIAVSRSFRNIDEYWRMATSSPRIAAVLGDISPDLATRVREATRQALAPAPDGTVTPTARANAIVGHAPP